jgi:hypothetical protein
MGEADNNQPKKKIVEFQEEDYIQDYAPPIDVFSIIEKKEQVSVKNSTGYLTKPAISLEEKLRGLFLRANKNTEKDDFSKCGLKPRGEVPLLNKSYYAYKKDDMIYLFLQTKDAEGKKAYLLEFCVNVSR